MEGTGLVAPGDEVTSVNQDAESWSRMEPGICDMILEKLPHLECHRLRVVCKEWYCSALQSLEHKPYLVSVVKREYQMEREFIGLFEYNVASKSLIFEPLVPIQLGSPYRAVDGLIFCERPEDENKWCVYNIHTGTKHVVPPAPGSGEYISGMMVDTSVKPYTFKLVFSYSSGEAQTQIYNSASRSWSLHPNSNSSKGPHRDDELFLTLCHKGSMYMSSKYSGGSGFVYSMEEDQWTHLRGSQFRGYDWPYLGAWDDRIFAVVHNAVSVIVWELVDGKQREWVEYARCPKALCEQFIEYPLFSGLTNYKREYVSVFCEEYVLMQSWYGCRSSYGLVLLNLKSREWESHKVDEAEDYYDDYA